MAAIASPAYNVTLYVFFVFLETLGRSATRSPTVRACFVSQIEPSLVSALRSRNRANRHDGGRHIPWFF